MRLYELFGDWVLTWPVVEQAEKRADVEKQICRTGYQVIRHLIKIYSWDNPIDYNNHVKDINGWLDPIYDIKIKGNKYPKANDYYNWLMSCAVSSSFITRQNGNIDYDVPRSGKSDEEVFEIIKTIIRNVSDDMADRKFVHAKYYMI